MTEHVLVTGGAGFIGSHSVDALLAAGRRVTVLDNFSAGRADNLPVSPELTVIRGDIRDAAAVQAAMAGATRVLHLAAQVSVQKSMNDPVDSCHQNVVGFLNVLDAARRAGVPRVVYASSAAVYGVPDTLPLDELAEPAPISPYGLEKSVNDQYAHLYHRQWGMSVLGLRYFNVYGPRQDPTSPYAGVISKFARGLIDGTPLRVFGDGGQTRDFVYVGDVARVNLMALDAGYSGVCNVGTGHSVTLLELIQALAGAAGRTPEVRHEPPAAGDIRHSAMSPGLLREVFGEMALTPLAQGLERLLEYERGRS